MLHSIKSCLRLGKQLTVLIKGLLKRKDSLLIRILLYLIGLQLKALFDGTGSLWGSGALQCKPFTLFTSTASQNGCVIAINSIHASPEVFWVKWSCLPVGFYTFIPATFDVERLIWKEQHRTSSGCILARSIHCSSLRCAFQGAGEHNADHAVQHGPPWHGESAVILHFQQADIWEYLC